MTANAFAALLICGAVLAIAIVWVPPAAARRPSPFDEHAAVAAALLQPDAPIFTQAEEAQLHLGDQVEAWLRDNTTQES